jgi:DNA-binding MarR family transcriptional regulator
MMTESDERAFANEVARFYARRYGVPPMAGRLLGWLVVCEPPDQTPARLSEALGVSRSGIGAAIALLERWSYIQRVRVPGERAERIRLQPDVWSRALENPSEYIEQAALARRGLQLLADAPIERRARLLEVAALAEFLAHRMPDLGAEWKAHRAALQAAGDLPATA